MAVVDEVAELTVRDLGDDRAARAAQVAANGRLWEIAGLGRSVDIHLVCCTQRPDDEAVPGQMKANLAGTVSLRVRAPVNGFILLDSDRAPLLPPRAGRAVFAHETVGEFQAVSARQGEPRAAAGEAGFPGSHTHHWPCLTLAGNYMPHFRRTFVREP